MKCNPFLSCFSILQIFAERPLTREIEEVLVRDVMYLLNLCSHLKNTILKSILQASNACLGELRDTTDDASWRAKIEVSLYMKLVSCFYIHISAITHSYSFFVPFARNLEYRSLATHSLAKLSVELH